jgi:FkbM family methyltransferase
MKYCILLRTIIKKVREILFPTQHDREIRRYFSDGGDEIFRYDFDLNEDSIVLDLGGFKGQWSSDIYARYNCNIMVFEPVRLFYTKISERFQKNKRIKVFNLALGGSMRQETINICEDGSSIFGQSQLKETIEVEDIATFLNHQNIKKVDLIKINIEGGEYEVLTRLIETGIINNIKQIQVQFHNVEKDSVSKMERICHELRETHVPTFQYKFVWENWIHISP